MIIGAGGHGKVVGELALLNDYKVIDFFDDKFKEINNFPFNIIGPIKAIAEYIDNYTDFFVAVGNNRTRYAIMSSLKQKKINFAKLAHPSSTISKFAVLEAGTCIMANAVINAGSIIQEGVIINTSASIDHDCYIEEFAHISPNCSIPGNVKIGKFSHLGTGTSVYPGINIGQNVKTGIGSKIYKDILDNIIFKN